jgi:hypothetical protein
MNQHAKPESGNRKVHVEALYVSRALTKNFVAEPERTVAEVIAEAYSRFGETPRSRDVVFGGEDPRVDLATYSTTTLNALAQQGIAIRDNGHGKLELVVEIETEAGGA